MPNKPVGDIIYRVSAVPPLYKLGKATEANLPFLDTSFFTKYQYLNYNWFSFQNLFLQTGWVGITLYVSFFFSLLIYNLYQKYSAPVRYRYLYDITITIALICILVIWKNATANKKKKKRQLY